MDDKIIENAIIDTFYYVEKHNIPSVVDLGNKKIIIYPGIGIDKVFDYYFKKIKDNTECDSFVIK